MPAARVHRERTQSVCSRSDMNVALHALTAKGPLHQANFWSTPHALCWWWTLEAAQPRLEQLQQPSDRQMSQYIDAVGLATS